MPTSPGVETQPKASGEKAIVIDWVGGTETITYMVEIRNVGGVAVDVSQFCLSSSPSACPADARLGLIRGSFALAPGAKALILTHPDVPTDDLPRREHSNLYWAVERAQFPSLPISSIALIDASGSVAASPPVGLDGGLGFCCKPAEGDDPCGNAPSCTAPDTPDCMTLVSKGYCCNTLDWCAWKQSTAIYCIAQTCTGGVFGNWDCCN